MFWPVVTPQLKRLSLINEMVIYANGKKSLNSSRSHGRLIRTRRDEYLLATTQSPLGFRNHGPVHLHVGTIRDATMSVPYRLLIS